MQRLGNDGSRPEVVTAGSFGGSPAPAAFDESDLGPEKIRLKVFRNPRSQDPEVQAASVGFFEVLDESAAVFDEASVSSDPDLKNPAFADSVRAP
jgi:hypothetical protein